MIITLSELTLLWKIGYKKYVIGTTIIELLKIVPTIKNQAKTVDLISYGHLRNYSNASQGSRNILQVFTEQVGCLFLIKSKIYQKITKRKK